MSEPNIPAEVLREFSALGPPQPMRRGSLSERYMKCSRGGCACVDDPESRHGPYFSLTRGVGGRTQSRLIRSDQVGRVQQQVERAQRFREQIEDYWQACERWADAELEASEAVSQGAAEKKGSKRLSNRRSSRKSNS